MSKRIFQSSENFVSVYVSDEMTEATEVQPATSESLAMVIEMRLKELNRGRYITNTMEHTSNVYLPHYNLRSLCQAVQTTQEPHLAKPLPIPPIPYPLKPHISVEAGFDKKEDLANLKKFLHDLYTNQTIDLSDVKIDGPMTQLAKCKKFVAEIILPFVHPQPNESLSSVSAKSMVKPRGLLDAKVVDAEDIYLCEDDRRKVTLRVKFHSELVSVLENQIREKEGFAMPGQRNKSEDGKKIKAQVKDIIKKQLWSNPNTEDAIKAFDSFCGTKINQDLRIQIIQHLLSEQYEFCMKIFDKQTIESTLNSLNKQSLADIETNWIRTPNLTNSKHHGLYHALMQEDYVFSAEHHKKLPTTYLDNINAAYFFIDHFINELPRPLKSSAQEIDVLFDSVESKQLRILKVLQYSQKFLEEKRVELLSPIFPNIGSGYRPRTKRGGEMKSLNQQWPCLLKVFPQEVLQFIELSNCSPHTDQLEQSACLSQTNSESLRHPSYPQMESAILLGKRQLLPF